jgi:hypothetical protein
MIDLDSRDSRTGLGQSECERSESGADLDHMIPGSDGGQPGDPAHGVGVGHEVLTEGATRRE